MSTYFIFAAFQWLPFAVDVTLKSSVILFAALTAATILKWSPILEDLNHYGLKVTGLATGQYEVRTGGKKIAAYSADQLAVGVNLAAGALSASSVALPSMPVVASPWRSWNSLTASTRVPLYFASVVAAGCAVSDKTPSTARRWRSSDRRVGAMVPPGFTAAPAGIGVQPPLVARVW